MAFVVSAYSTRLTNWMACSGCKSSPASGVTALWHGTENSSSHEPDSKERLASYTRAHICTKILASAGMPFDATTCAGNTHLTF